MVQNRLVMPKKVAYLIPEDAHKVCQGTKFPASEAVEVVSRDIPLKLATIHVPKKQYFLEKFGTL